MMPCPVGGVPPTDQPIQGSEQAAAGVGRMLEPDGCFVTRQKDQRGARKLNQDLH